jgi:hypothetical protein
MAFVSLWGDAGRKHGMSEVPNGAQKFNKFLATIEDPGRKHGMSEALICAQKS